MSWRRGGVYSNFVSSSDDNTPYRGAEIPPPPNLQGLIFCVASLMDFFPNMIIVVAHTHNTVFM